MSDDDVTGRPSRSDGLLFSDETGASRLLLSGERELLWRFEDKPGDWHSLRPPLTYDPKVRQLRALGFSRPVTLSLMGSGRRRRERQKHELLSQIHRSHKATAFPIPQAAGDMVDPLDADRAVSEHLGPDPGCSADGDGEEISQLLKSIAVLSQRAGCEHGVMPVAVAQQRSALHTSLNYQQGALPPRRVVNPSETVYLLGEVRVAPYLRVACSDCPVICGEYTLDRAGPRPGWRRGALRIYFALGRWLVGWESDMAVGRGFLMATEGRFPYLSSKWLKSDGAGGWLVAQDARVEAVGEGATWSLVETASGQRGYVTPSALRPAEPHLALGVPTRSATFLLPACAAALCILLASTPLDISLPKGTAALVMHEGAWVWVNITDDTPMMQRIYSVVGSNAEGIAPLGSFRALVEKTDRQPAEPREVGGPQPPTLPLRDSAERSGRRQSDAGSKKRSLDTPPPAGERSGATPPPNSGHSASSGGSRPKSQGVDPAKGSAPPVDARIANSSEWVIGVSKRRKTGQVYYRNRTTGETRWALPTEVV